MHDSRSCFISAQVLSCISLHQCDTPHRHRLRREHPLLRRYHPTELFSDLICLLLSALIHYILLSIVIWFKAYCRSILLWYDRLGLCGRL